MAPANLLLIAYALAPKKQRSLLQPSLLQRLQLEGIHLIAIDTLTPLSQQGPFDVILHKMPGEAWNRQLTEFAKEHPDVVVIDPPDAIHRLHNRVSMLEAVTELQVCGEGETFGIPKQVVLADDQNLNDISASSALRFPLIAKPLVADGSANSHSMSLVFNPESLSKLKPPVVLQEFINHGGVIFKVYVVGEFVQCVRRRSLPDVHENDLPNHHVPLSFSQISNMASSGESDGLAGLNLPQIDLPSAKFISNVASGLRRVLGLQLFNFDIIRDSTASNQYYVIDINYFPGYAKMPAYENVLTQFFLSLAQGKAHLQDSYR